MLRLSTDALKALLYEDESTSLDFKRDQYPFSGASDQQKAELLKDILAFANSWRRSAAYIIIGVQEVHGGRGNVTGLTEYLNDADLQQFVNSKTQRPVEFAYQSYEINGQKIGVIQIPIQRRPIFLKQNYGGLKKNEVYVRRGSSTAIADPDEIALMGKKGLSQNTPTLHVVFAKRTDRKLLESVVEINSVELLIPVIIPDFRGTVVQESEFGISAGMGNRNYYRELAKFIKAIAISRSLDVGIINSSEILAEGIRLEIVIEDPDNMLFVMDDYDFPERPKSSSFGSTIMNPEYDLSVTELQSKWLIGVQVGKVQPQSTAFPRGSIHLGSRESGTINLNVTIFGDNIPQPIRSTLTANISSVTKNIELDDILNIDTNDFPNTKLEKLLIEKAVIEDESQKSQ